MQKLWKCGAVGMKVAIIGDLHLSDRAVGRHKDYFKNCMDICGQISQFLVSEQITHLILAGDIIGTGDINTLKTQQARLLVMQVFAQWNTLCKNNVYTIYGNHDYGSGIGDVDLLVTARLLTKLDTLDVGAYHFIGVDYGRDTEPLKLSNDLINVAVTHTFFKIENKTNYIPIPGGVELSDMQNFKGVSVVANGHIHYPSNAYMTTSIGDSSVSLINLGCPTRPSASEVYNSVPILVCETLTKDGVSEAFEKLAVMNLVDKVELNKSEEASDALVDNTIVENDVAQIEELSKILSELQGVSLSSELSYRQQLERFSNNNAEAVELAYSYIQKASQRCSNSVIS